MIGSALGALDGVLAFLPAWFRLCLYGGVAGAGAMLLYGRLSPQDRLDGIQRALAEARARMHAYDGDEVKEIGRLVKASLGLSFTQIRLVLAPTLLAALPVLLAIAWLDPAFSHTLPAPGTPVTVEYWTAAGGEPAPDSPVAWPSASNPLTLRGPGGAELVTLPLEHARARLTRRSWWHDIFANPAGYLPDDGRVALVALGLPERHFLPFGPDWLRGWHTLFLAVLSAAAVAVKYGRGIR